MSLRLWRERMAPTPAQVLDLPVDQVLLAWQFIKFQDDYQETTHVLNTDER